MSTGNAGIDAVSTYPSYFYGMEFQMNRTMEGKISWFIGSL